MKPHHHRKAQGGRRRLGSHPSLFQLTSPKAMQFLPNWTLSPLPAGEAANKCLTSCHECLAVPDWLCVTWGVSASLGFSSAFSWDSSSQGAVGTGLPVEHRPGPGRGAASPCSLCLLSQGQGGDKSLQPQARCHSRGQVSLVPAEPGTGVGAHPCSSCSALQEPWSWDGASAVRLGEAQPSCLGGTGWGQGPPLPLHHQITPCKSSGLSTPHPPSSAPTQHKEAPLFK